MGLYLRLLACAREAARFSNGMGRRVFFGQIAVYMNDSCEFCFLVRKESRLATGLIALGITAFLAACENGGASASKTGTTDPNTAFAEYGARTNTPTGLTGDVSPRRGTGFSGGPGARGGGNQTGF
jgi:hypothetical protein